MLRLGWLFTESVPQFLAFASSLAGYEFSPSELEAYVELISEADAESGSWVALPQSPSRNLMLELAPDPGSSVTHVRAQGDDVLLQQLCGVCHFLTQFRAVDRV